MGLYYPPITPNGRKLPPMKLEQVTIENYRAIAHLDLPLDPNLTVIYGDNAQGKTSVLSAIAVGLGSIARYLPNVSAIDFVRTDRRGSHPMGVKLTTTRGIRWERWRGAGTRQRSIRLLDLGVAINEIVKADQEGSPPMDLPIVAYYDTDRAVFDAPQQSRGLRGDYPRYAALAGALSARTNFRQFFQWFYAKENEELREQRELSDLDYRLKELDAVRRAIESMIPGVSRPRIAFRPLRFVVDTDSNLGTLKTTDFNQLSGGYRIVLAMVSDIARRMAQGNPHLDDPLDSEAIVLIDEVELHLHPLWQQRVIPDLTRTFPKAQFIVSTHSPQVLTTVRPERIVGLNKQASDIVAGSTMGTFGAESGYVLDTVMGVSERPPGNEFVTKLEEYRRIVGDGLGESEQARTIRRSLEELSPRDPALSRADMEIKRKKILSSMGKSE